MKNTLWLAIVFFGGYCSALLIARKPPQFEPADLVIYSDRVRLVKPFNPGDNIPVEYAKHFSFGEWQTTPKAGILTYQVYLPKAR